MPSPGGRLLVLGTLVSLTACPDASASGLRCEQYPIRSAPVGGALAAAQAELSAISPAATLTWNDDTGTLIAVNQLALPLPGCVDGADVGTQVLAVIAAHPQLFQLDLSEWRIPLPFDCRFLDGFTIISMGRLRLAGRAVAKDVFAFTLRRVNGVVQLLAVNGTYLPRAAPAISDAMATCNELTPEAAAATARSTALRTSLFSLCQKVGTATYTPKPDDSFELFPEAWTWDEDTGRVLLTGQRVLRVTVNPSNYISTFKLSDARCPALEGDGDGTGFTVGFDVTFDVHTGAVLNVKPGLDCVVC